MQATERLRRYPLFSVLDSAAVAAWLEAGEVRTVELGETLFQAGTPGAHAYLVQAGRVRVVRHTKEGREVLLGTFGPGELFGEYALLPPGQNTATCRVADAGRVLALPLEPLRAAVAARPWVSLHLKRWLRLHSVLGYVRNRSFLGFMSASSLLPLLDRFETARYAAGLTIQAEGLSDDSWFVIMEGKARLASSDSLLGAGDCFGAQGLVDGLGLCSAEAVAATECMYLRRETFNKSLSAAGSIVPSLQTHLSRRHAVASYPWVGQRDANDCGLAALAMVARYHHLSTSMNTLQELIPVGHRGTSLAALQHAAVSLGFHAHPVRVGFEQLASTTLPAIAHLAHDHYVVLYAVDSTGVVVGDPAAAVVTLAPEAFRGQWSGHVLLLTR